MKKIHLIYGYLGTGKTTFAKELEQTLPAIRFSFDDWMTQFYGNNPPVEKFQEYHSNTASFINDFWPKLVHFNIEIVLDFGFWLRSERDEVRAKATEAGADTVLYHVNCNEQVALKRCLERNNDLKGSFEICENTYQVLKERFEPLGPDEPFELVDTT